MAGGIFDNQPFSLNLKCIIFTLLLAGGYWYLPPKKIWILISLLYFPYLALAWYDYIYDCRVGLLQPTIFPFGEYVYLPFKPPDYKERYANMSLEKKTKIKEYGRFIAAVLFGVILVFLIRSRKF